MRTDGSDDEGIQLLSEDRASCGEAVRRRADRRADDKAVAGVACRRLAIDEQVHLDEWKRRPCLDRRLVESQMRDGRRRAAVFLDEALEHKMFGHAKFALNDARKDLARFRRTEVGEK